MRTAKFPNAVFLMYTNLFLSGKLSNSMATWKNGIHVTHFNMSCGCHFSMPSYPSTHGQLLQLVVTMHYMNASFTHQYQCALSTQHSEMSSSYLRFISPANVSQQLTCYPTSSVLQSRAVTPRLSRHITSESRIA
jgi:hypothetical protein